MIVNLLVIIISVFIVMAIIVGYVFIMKVLLGALFSATRDIVSTVSYSARNSMLMRMKSPMNCNVIAYSSKFDNVIMYIVNETNMMDDTHYAQAVWSTMTAIYHGSSPTDSGFDKLYDDAIAHRENHPDIAVKFDKKMMWEEVHSIIA